MLISTKRAMYLKEIMCMESDGVPVVLPGWVIVLELLNLTSYM